MFLLIRTSLISFFIFDLASLNAMTRAIHTAATGMAAQEQNVNNISNNIANVNTVGFKKNRVEFQDLTYQTITEAGARSNGDTQYSIGVQIGSGAKVSGVRKDFTAGNSQLTNNPFDLMVSGGEGFFAVMLPNGDLRFTRDGSFNLDNQGNFVNKQGYRIFPGIQFPPNTKSVAISEDGVVEAFLNNEIEPQNLGQIPLFTFVNTVGLRSIGGNLYNVTRSSGQAMQNIAGENNAGVITQGALESSNVSIMNEMTDLIRAQRAYEMNSKVMGIADQMMQTVNNIK